MSEPTLKGHRARGVSAPTRDPDDAERSLGRAVALGIPLACLAGAIVVGALSSVGSALLVLASGALIGTVALLWASVRTLSGDAPLPGDLEALAGQRHGVDARAEHKRRVLRSLKDLESEHALGKIDDADYEAFVTRYRQEAKVVMRDMDLQVAPVRAEAERIAREYLARQRIIGAGPTATTGLPITSPAAVVASRSLGSERPTCAGCETSNEPDAAYCKRCGSTMKRAGGP
jgi:hypothetical protein